MVAGLQADEMRTYANSDETALLDAEDGESMVSVAAPSQFIRGTSKQQLRKADSVTFNQSHVARLFRNFRDGTPNQNRELYARMARDNQLKTIIKSFDQFDYGEKQSHKIFCTVYVMLQCAYKQSTSSPSSGHRKRRDSSDGSDLSTNPGNSCKRAKLNGSVAAATNTTDNSAAIDMADGDDALSTTNETIIHENQSDVETNGEKQHQRRQKNSAARPINLAVYVPDVLQDVKSKWAMYAIATYCLRRHKTSLLAKTMLKIRRNDFIVCRELVDYLLCDDMPKQLAAIDAKHFHTVFDHDERATIAYSIFETARIVNDKNISMIALELDFKYYLRAVDMLKARPTDSLAPYYAAFVSWANQCVAPVSKKQKFVNMCERFKANSESTVAQIVKDLQEVPLAEDQLTAAQRRKIDPCFDPDQYYHVFSKGGPNWALDVYPLSMTVDNSTYNLLLYKGCVFDVLSIDGQSTDNCSWDERLKKLNEPCVTLDYMLGSEMERRFAKRIVGASWMKDALSHYKMFEFKKKN